MKRKQINLWPLLPFAIIAFSLVLAYFVPDAQAERTSTDSSALAAEVSTEK